MHDAYIGGHFWRTKITRKGSDVAENQQLYRVVRFSPEIMYDDAYIDGHSENNINASCMTI